METPLIQAKNLSIGYNKKQKRKIIQKNLNLEVFPGQLICLIGPNGSGKSTLLHTLTGVLPPLDGEILVNGDHLPSLNLEQRSKLFSFVLTDSLDIPLMSVYDLVAMGRNPYTGWRGNLREKDHKMILESLQQVHLEKFETRTLSSLSDGERQRAIIAKALAQDTPLVFLDEPTAHLDINNRIEILILLTRLAHDTHKAILLSTHELELAIETADKLWLLDSEGGISTGTPDKLIEEKRIQQTFHGRFYLFDEKQRRFIIKCE